MFLGQNLIVSVFVLNASLDTRFLVSGKICSWWQWFHRQVCTSGWVTSMPPWYVLQDRWTRENIQFLLPFTTLVDGEIHQSHHICRGAEKPLLPCLVSQQPQLTNLLIAHNQLYYVLTPRKTWSKEMVAHKEMSSWDFTARLYLCIQLCMCAFSVWATMKKRMREDLARWDFAKLAEMCPTFWSKKVKPEKHWGITCWSHLYPLTPCRWEGSTTSVWAKSNRRADWIHSADHSSD